MKTLGFIKAAVVIIKLNFFAFLGHAQIPTLSWAHQYGMDDQGEADDRVRNINFDPANNHYYVGGSFIEQIDVDVNLATNYLYSDLYRGFLAEYDSNFELVNSIVIGSSVYNAKSMGPDYLVVGVYYQSFDFDLTNNGEYLIDPEGFLSNNIFIARYNNNNELIWINRIASEGGETIRDITYSEDGILIVGKCNAGVNIYEGQNQTSVPSNAQDGFLAKITFDGAFENFWTFGTSSTETLWSVSQISGQIGISGEYESEVDIGWNGPSALLPDPPALSGFFAIYNSQHELIHHITFENQGANEFQDLKPYNVGFDFEGNFYGVILLRNNEYIIDFQDTTIFREVNGGELFVFKLNPQFELMWTQSFTTTQNSGELIGSDDIEITSSGHIFLAGRFNSDLIFPQGDPILEGGLNSGWFTLLNPDGSIISAFTIASGQGYSNIRSIISPNPQELYIGGEYSAIDLDLTEEGTFGLGSTNENDGFIAKYELDPLPPKLLVEQSWENTSVSESGTTDAIYFRLNTIPTSSVQIVLTPDNQLDLGNGPGESVSINFEANESAYVTQTVVVNAINDLVVEGNHFGIVSIEVVSLDNEYASLNPATISASIADNDVVGVEEKNLLSFDLYPNPARDHVVCVPNQLNHITYNIHIIDVTGKAILIQQCSGRSVVDISPLSKGYYLIQFPGGITKSFVKL